VHLVGFYYKNIDTALTFTEANIITELVIENWATPNI
jgi:hypothetical protein